VIGAVVAAAALALVPTTESVTAGPVTATLSWQGEAFAAQGTTLTIARDGVTAFSQPIPKVVCDGCALPGNGAEDVQVTDFDGDGEREVVVSGLSGGEDGSALMGVYDYRPDTGTTASSCATGARRASGSTTSTATGSPRSSRPTCASRGTSAGSRRRGSSTTCTRTASRSWST
jgi:hypothetical protein